jgi:hypothetical protein
MGEGAVDDRAREKASRGLTRRPAAFRSILGESSEKDGAQVPRFRSPAARPAGDAALAPALLVLHVVEGGVPLVSVGASPVHGRTGADVARREALTEAVPGDRPAVFELHVLQPLACYAGALRAPVSAIDLLGVLAEDVPGAASEGE